MTWISSLVSRYRRNIHIITILLFSGISIFGSNRLTGLVSEAILGSLYQPFFKIRAYVEDLSSVNAENRRLRMSLVETTLRLSELEDVKRENLRLRSVLNFEPPPGYSLLPARMMSVSGDGLPVSAVINRGEVDSVFVNQALINQEGLIGRVFSVTPSYATIQLLTDPGSRVAVRIAESREMGIVRHMPSKGMILDNFPVQGQISEGDVVLSSGLGGVYPAGLLVGRVLSVERPEREPFCSVRLEAAAKISSLEDLFILRPVLQ